MNDEPQCVENEPRYKLYQEVYFYDSDSNKVLKSEVRGLYLGEILFKYFLKIKNIEDIFKFILETGTLKEMSESQIFPDFNSCKVAAHATYLQKIKDLLEQKDE